MFSRTTVSCLLLFYITLATFSVFADNKSESKQHFKSGITLLKGEDFDAAAAEFERSIELHPTKSGYFNLANCYKAMHKYSDSLSILRKMKFELRGQLGDEMLAAVDKLEKEVRSLVAGVIVKVDKENIVIKIDGKEVGKSHTKEIFLISPGKHTIEIFSNNTSVGKQDAQVYAGDKKTFNFAVDESKLVVLIPLGSVLIGGACKKDVDCQGDSSICQNQICTALAPSATPVPEQGYATAPGYSQTTPGKQVPNKANNQDAANTPSPKWYKRFYGGLSIPLMLTGVGGWTAEANEVDGNELDETDADGEYTSSFRLGAKLSAYFVLSEHFHLGGYYSFSKGDVEFQNGESYDENKNNLERDYG